MSIKEIDVPRLCHYERLEKVFRGNHEAVFNLDGDSQFPNVIVNLPTGIINGLTGLVAGKSPRIKVETQIAQGRVDQILENSNFGPEVQQFVKQGLLYGDSVMRVVDDDRGGVKLRCVSPKFWHAVPDSDDPDTIIEHILGFEKKVGPERRLFREESHTAGFIVNRIWELKGKKLQRQLSLEDAGVLVPEWAGLEPLIETGVDETLVISWSYNKLCGEVYGTSELMSIWGLMAALDRRATQEDRVLAKHADPKLLLPAELIERDANGNPVVPVDKLDVIVTSPGQDKDKMGYLTWDGKLDHVREAKKWLVEMALHNTQVSRLLLNADNTQAQTGVAVMGQLLPSIIKAEQLQKEIEGPLRTMLRVAQKRARVVGRNFAPSRVSIEWGINLPVDIQSLVQANVMMVQAGLKTPQEAKETIEVREKL